ncbi:MAG TPA: CHAT domain-containing protein [Thermoanaerobaculia bacterium]|nr:CHAT domain-containing protein [Thermoanaerobaculia bacterium]
MLLSLTLALALVSPPTAPDTATRAFYAAYASGGVDDAAAFWADAERAGFIRKHARAMSVRCRTMWITRVSVTAQDGDAARVEVDASEAVWLGDRVARIVPHNAVLVLRRVPDGRWLITDWHRREEDLADQWLALTTAAERNALLQRNRALCTPALADAMGRRAISLSNQGRLDDLLPLVRTAIQIAEESGDDVALARAHATASVAYYNVDDDAALAHANEAIAIAERAGDPDALAESLYRFSRTSLAVQEDGMAAYVRALSFADDLVDVSVAAKVAAELAFHTGNAAEYRQAFQYALTATRLAAMSDSPAAQYNSILQLAEAYYAQGGYEMALVHYERLLGIARAQNYSATYEILFFLASCYRRLGRMDEFFRLTDEAMAAPDMDACGDPAPEVLAQSIVEHARRGDYATAEQLLDEAECRAVHCEKTALQAAPAVARAYLRFQQNRLDEAFTAARQAEGEKWEAVAVMAKVLRARGRNADARAKLESIRDEFESARENVADPELRSSYLQERSAVYRDLVDLLADANDPRAAFEAAERLKARVLREIRGERKATLLEIATTDEREQVRSARAQIASLNRSVVGSGRRAGDSAALETQLSHARLALQDLETRVRVAHEGRGSFQRTESVLEVVPPEGVSVVEYVVGEKRTIAFTVTRNATGDAEVAQTIIPVSQDVLRKQVDAFLRKISSRSSAYSSEARALYDLLVAPIESHLRGQTICIIPDAELWRLPFDALKTPDGKHLIERNTIFYVPSYALLEEDHEPRDAGAPTLLAIGNPRVGALAARTVRSWYRDATLGDLPDAEEEVRAIERLYGGRAQVYVGAAATEETVKQESGRFQILHFATHGLLDANAPLFSSLLLAPSQSDDGVLEAREITELDLHADLAILSACDTARGEFEAGEGILGLSWALMATGCPRTIGSQWKVSSAATTQLMIALHRRLAARKSLDHVAGDLRSAQLELLRGTTYAHPYYWAGFVLIGRD